METVFRIPQKTDYDAIASWVVDEKACARWAGPTVPFPFSPERLPELLEMDGCSSYCLSDSNNECIGVGQFWTGEHGAVHIGRIIISPEVRGIGAGRVLCEKLIDRALRSTGAHIVTLRVYRDNNAARSLYSSLGFFVVDSESTGDLLFMRALTNKIRKADV
ncbi:MAG: GNAT family N-acetyltransferase [Corynebacterium sp.]|uniref:GNAT family N-acetyltransferase n=1 Tax=Corynebacterium sp. TaxID=1720 RepID=UPI00184161AD|nr:GNAT family N-acetyltransferase [Corynebacterium sp.]